MRQPRGQGRRYTDTEIYLRFALRSLIVTFILEILNRGSVLAAFSFMTGRIVPFLCNALIIFTTLSVSRLFGRRRRFFANLFTLLWLLFGLVNAIVLRYRMTPFSAEDFAMVTSLFRIAKNYLTPITIILLVALAVFLIALIVFMWMRVPKVGYEGRFLFVLIKTAVCFLAATLAIRGAMSIGQLSNEFENLADAYNRYGFSYCFLTSIVDVGIDRPQGYSAEMMDEIAKAIRRGEDPATEPTAPSSSYSGVRPNIIMIQLESFFDPTYLKGVTYSEDPIPCFRELKEQCPSGFLTVPVVGAGTSNTEFEILTGMSTSYFGAGEYPYNTILRERTVEALPHILSRAGYVSTAIHNNTGTFYNRNIVFRNMGFDNFIPQEYMYDLERTPNNWAKDDVLTDIMMDTLRESDAPDFIYTITVQSHGRYPSERVLSDEERVIRVRPQGSDIPKESLEYYVNEIHEVDEMVKALIARLETFEEPVVLVLFGDHLPALGFGADDLKNRHLYDTEYVIWNNFGMEGEDGKLESEQLGARVLEPFDLAQGIISRFHIACESEAYMDTFKSRKAYRTWYKQALEALEYDMLYGEGYIFGAFAEDIPGLNLPERDDGEKTASHAGGKETKSGYHPSNMTIRYLPILMERIQTGMAYLEEEAAAESNGTNGLDSGNEPASGGRKEAASEGGDGDGTASGNEKEAASENNVIVEDDALIVRGENFNEYSKIMIDSKPKETIYLDRETLMLEGTPPASYDMISVGQFDENMKQLGKCANYIFYPQLGRPAR